MTAKESLQASSIFTINNSKVTAGFRTHDKEVLAGGPLRVEFFVETDQFEPLYLPVRADRAKLRQANYSFSASIEAREINLEDPAAQIPDEGGLGTVAKVERGVPYRQNILVNEFVRLENLAIVLSPGETVLLQLRCQRSLSLANSMKQGLEGRAKGWVVDVTLAIPVKRDDPSLETLIADLATRIDANRSDAVSAERELAIAELVALRNPLILPYLQKLSDHPDPVVGMYVARGLAFLNRSKET